MKKSIFLLIILLTNITLIQCQDFGGFSNDISWKQIKTRPVRVIFPSGMEEQAFRVANMLGYIDKNNRITIGDSFKKIDLILNNQGVIPNGYVALTPYRSEFYTTPFQKSGALGSLPWLDLLAIHEYRHALQYSNFPKGITKLGYLLTGETFWSAAMFLSTPDWYFEGDAVTSETALSNQGRGRIPSFYQSYKSILNSRKPYTYEKARNGSFKHDVPDHYSLGYLLTSFGREEYNDSLWLNVMDRTARFKGIIYPFSKALKHHTGFKSRQFYKEALNSYQDKWDQELLRIGDDNSQELSRPGKTITNYTYSVFDPHSKNWLSVKSSYQKTAAIYELKHDGSEEKITNLGINLDAYFSAGTKNLIWAEITRDARFTSLSYSDIVVFDRSSKKKKIVTKGQRLFSPAISPDESKFVAVQANLMEDINLLVLDISNGEVLKEIPNPDNLYYTYPIWTSNGRNFISSVRYPNGDMGIVEIDSGTGYSKVIVAPSNNIIGNVSLSGNKVFYSASFEGRDNIFSTDLTNLEIVQWTNSKFGASNPGINPELNTICFSDYSHNGKALKTTKLTKPIKTGISTKGLNDYPSFNPSYAEVEGGDILAQIPDSTYEVTNYYPILNSIKVHSWMPKLNLWPLEGKNATIGFGLSSANVLNNLHFDAGYNYYLNEKSSGFSASAIYGQFLPILSANYSQGFRDAGSSAEESEYLWERKLGAGVQIPLDFSQGMYYRSFSGGASINYTSIPANSISSEILSSAIQFTTVGFDSRFSITRRSAYQNISTPLGIAGEIQFNRSISSTKASQLQLYIDAGARGFLPNHNFIVDFSYKSENAWNPYQFPDVNSYPRGYTITNNSWIATWQFNYHFPIFYPDFGFMGIVYMKRVRGNIFTDFGAGEIINGEYNVLEYHTFQTLGAELIFDLKFLNVLPVAMGLRISALGTPDTHDPSRSSHFEVFFPNIRL